MPRTVTHSGWATLAEVAEYMQVHINTVRGWVRAGALKAGRAQSAHYSDTRPRRTMRGHWRVYGDDLADFLERMRGSRRIPPGLLRGG